MIFLIILSFIALVVFVLGFLKGDDEMTGCGFFFVAVITIVGWGFFGTLCTSTSTETPEQWTVVKTTQGLSLVQGNSVVKVEDIEEFQLLEKQPTAEMIRVHNYNMYGGELNGSVKLNKAKLLLTTLPKKSE